MYAHKCCNKGYLACMAPELLPGDMLLQSASLCDYKTSDIWSLGMTLFCKLHPDLGSPFLIELPETGFDVHRNTGESLSEIILKSKRPKSSTKYQNTLINHWLKMWFALSQCLKMSKKGSHYGENLKGLRNLFLEVWKLAQIHHF